MRKLLVTHRPWRIKIPMDSFRLPFTSFALAFALSAQCGPRMDSEARAGKAVAERQCIRCHAFPDSAVLPKGAWPEVLDRMGQYLGHDDMRLALRLRTGSEQEVRNLRVQINLDLLPKEPLATDAEWKQLRHYFETTSVPEVNKKANEALTERTDLFAAVYPEYNPGDAFMTAVRIDARGHRAFAADASSHTLVHIAPDGKTIRTRTTPGEAVALEPRKDGLAAAYAGTIFPSNLRRGSIEMIPYDAGPARLLLSGLYRTAHAAFADMRGDGRETILVSSFGHHQGRFSVFESASPTGGPPYKEKMLLDRAGPIQAMATDFDGDGKKDILALTAQAREGLTLFTPKGDGTYAERQLIEKHPAFGFVRFTVADLNGDGDEEVITANGDNGDLTSAPLKDYHGIRVYKKKNGGLTEAFFYPMHGAYGVCTGDFDGDGRRDIAAISFYPDFSLPKPESFTILLNTGGLDFKPVTVPESHFGRWLTMDCGDIDGDGKTDIVLGAAYDPRLSGHKPEIWIKSQYYPFRRAVLILRGLTGR